MQITPSIGAMGCKSTATILGGAEVVPSSSSLFSNVGKYNFLLKTCDQLPGAAHKSTTFLTSSRNKLKLSSICISLKRRPRSPPFLFSLFCNKCLFYPSTISPLVLLFLFTLRMVWVDLRTRQRYVGRGAFVVCFEFF